MAAEGDISYVAEVTRALAVELSGLEAALLRLYALLVMACGEETSMTNVHDAWALWRSETAPGHASLRPYDQLDPAVQELDRPYMDAIHRVAARMATR